MWPWVWYCRPPIGAHFHPTPQPPPVPQQLGEKAHLRIAWSVAALRRPPLGGRTRLVIMIIIIREMFKCSFATEREGKSPDIGTAGC